MQIECRRRAQLFAVPHGVFSQPTHLHRQHFWPRLNFELLLKFYLLSHFRLSGGWPPKTATATQNLPPHKIRSPTIGTTHPCAVWCGSVPNIYDQFRRATFFSFSSVTRWHFEHFVQEATGYRTYFSIFCFRYFGCVRDAAKCGRLARF